MPTPRTSDPFTEQTWKKLVRFARSKVSPTMSRGISSKRPTGKVLARVCKGNAPLLMPSLYDLVNEELRRYFRQQNKSRRCFREPGRFAEYVVPEAAAPDDWDGPRTEALLHALSEQVERLPPAERPADPGRLSKRLRVPPLRAGRMRRRRRAAVDPLGVECGPAARSATRRWHDCPVASALRRLEAPLFWRAFFVRGGERPWALCGARLARE